MTQRSRSKQPRQDRTDQALFMLVEAMLDDFLFDADNRDRYEAVSRGGGGAPAKRGESAELASFASPDHGEARVTMRVGSPELTVAIGHSRFNATVEAVYDLEQGLMTESRVTDFNGDRETARASAEKWLEAFDTTDLDDDEMADALTELMDDASPFEGRDDPGEPPPPTEQDRVMVTALARSIAREMKRKKPDMLAHECRLLALEHAPQAVWPVLDGMVAACTASPRDESLIGAWRFILESQLTLIRYRIDSGWEWATRMAEEYQRKLLRISEEGLLRPADCAALAGALGVARIDVKPETRVALADAGMTSPEHTPPAALAGALRGLMDQMASFVSSPFDVAAALSEATAVMPAELNGYMAHEFARSSHDVLRDTVPLLLLDGESEVRRTAAAALEQTAAPDTMSPEALRRMIVIRNWVPDADRTPIDQAIRKARLKGVDCAPWPQAADMMITVSMIDGSGAQSIILTSRGGRKGVLAGVLLKLRVGVADAWCDTGAPRRAINETLVAVRDASPSSEVGPSYFDVAIQHAIAAGAASGRPPNPSLLRIAELGGGAEWRDRRLDIAAETKRLFELLPAEQRTAAAVEASLRRSGAWIEEDFAESWFLDDRLVRDIIRAGPKRDREATTRRVLEEAMPERRGEWAERFLLLALRAETAKAPDHKTRTRDFIILAHSLCDDGALASVPLMAAIARRTVEVARMARW